MSLTEQLADINSPTAKTDAVIHFTVPHFWIFALCRAKFTNLG